MIPKDFEQPMGLDYLRISQKTSAETVRKLSKQRWLSDGISCIAVDTLKNVEELVAGRIDWGSFLSGISTKQRGSVYYGKAAIVKDGAKLIGALAAGGDWAMHDPPIVYSSARLLASKAKSGGEIVRQFAVDYGQKVLPHANLFMEDLDFLLKLTNRTRHRHIIMQVESLLGKGDIEGAHKIVSYDTRI